MNEANTLDLFWESWEFFSDAALTGVVAGALLGWIGVYIVLRRMVFMSAAVTQASSLGVAYAFYVSVTWGAVAYRDGFVDAPPGFFLELLSTPLLVSTACALLVAVAMVVIPKQHADKWLGLMYLFGAAGTLILGTRIVEELQDIQTIIFGNAVLVSEDDANLVMGLAIVILSLHIAAIRGFSIASFDAVGGRTRGIPVRFLNVLLLASIAVAIAVTTRVLGALPVFAFSILPAIAAIPWAPNVYRAVWLAAAFGAMAAFIGYVAAFLYEVPVGAAQTIACFWIVVTSVALRTLGGMALRLRPSTTPPSAAE